MLLAAPAVAAQPGYSLSELLELVSSVKVTVDFEADQQLKNCTVVKSSGDKQIDQIPCEAARRCGLEKQTSTKSLPACSQRQTLTILNEGLPVQQPTADKK